MSIPHAAATNHPELHLRPQNQTPCPKSKARAYVKDGGDAPCPQITIDVLQRRLSLLDLKPGSPIRRNAASVAAKCGVDPTELLHMALDRAFRPNTSRPDVPILAYLTMLMRSVASGILKSRRRADERGISVPLDHVREQVPSSGSIRDPVRTLLRQWEQAYFQGLLDEIAGKDAVLARLIDGISLGKRGAALATSVGIGEGELATLRRRLKRRAIAVARREGLNGNAVCLELAGCGPSAFRSRSGKAVVVHLLSNVCF